MVTLSKAEKSFSDITIGSLGSEVTTKISERAECSQNDEDSWEPAISHSDSSLRQPVVSRGVGEHENERRSRPRIDRIREERP